MTEQERQLYITRRQALIMELGAIEDLLDMERSVTPKRKRDRTINVGEIHAESERPKTLMDEIAKMHYSNY